MAHALLHFRTITLLTRVSLKGFQFHRIYGRHFGPLVTVCYLSKPLNLLFFFVFLFFIAVRVSLLCSTSIIYIQSSLDFQLKNWKKDKTNINFIARRE